MWKGQYIYSILFAMAEWTTLNHGFWTIWAETDAEVVRKYEKH